MSIHRQVIQFYAKSLQSEGYMPIAGKKQIKDFAEKALQSKGWRPIAGRKKVGIQCKYE